MKRIILPILCLVALATMAQVVPNRQIAGIKKTTPVATNLWNATTQPARVFSITVYNSSATDLYLYVADTNSATVANNSLPSLAPVKITAGAAGFWAEPAGIPFGQGVTIGTSTTDRTLTNGTASFIITILYDGSPN